MTWAQLLAEAEAVLAAAGAAAASDPATGGGAPDQATGGAHIAGFAWATVDEERARAQLDELLATDRDSPAFGPWVARPRDPVLGACAWVRLADETADDPALVVLEPDTEGRLAAFLARFGEGVAAVYVGAGEPRPGRLASGAPAWGPFVVIMSLDPSGASA